MNALMRASVAETENESFGLLAAEQLQPQVLHGLGLAWLASDTVYDGLRRLVRFGRLMSSGADLSLQEDGELVHFQLNGNPASVDSGYALHDYSVGMILRMCRLTQSVSRLVVHKIIERLPDGPPNQQRIAADMNVSHRTLQRKLKDEGASFADLLKDT